MRIKTLSRKIIQQIK